MVNLQMLLQFLKVNQKINVKQYGKTNVLAATALDLSDALERGLHEDLHHLVIHEIEPKGDILVITLVD